MRVVLDIYSVGGSGAHYADVYVDAKMELRVRERSRIDAACKALRAIDMWFPRAHVEMCGDLPGE